MHSGVFRLGGQLALLLLGLLLLGLLLLVVVTLAVCAWWECDSTAALRLGLG